MKLVCTNIPARFWVLITLIKLNFSILFMKKTIEHLILFWKYIFVNLQGNNLDIAIISSFWLMLKCVCNVVKSIILKTYYMLWCSLQCKFAIHTIYSCICHPFFAVQFQITVKSLVTFRLLMPLQTGKKTWSSRKMKKKSGNMW